MASKEERSEEEGTAGRVVEMNIKITIRLEVQDMLPGASSPNGASTMPAGPIASKYSLFLLLFIYLLVPDGISILAALRVTAIGLMVWSLLDLGERSRPIICIINFVSPSSPFFFFIFFISHLPVFILIQFMKSTFDKVSTMASTAAPLACDALYLSKNV